MNVASLGGLIGSAAGSPLSQTSGSETERASRDGAAQQRQVDANQKAELAAGIGQTQEDQESSERDADGRRPWEAPTKQALDEEEHAEASTVPVRQSKDATGQCGNQLDLTG
ncbi:MAG: hypothetical protein WD468_11225 [Pirellulales bacterium]